MELVFFIFKDDLLTQMKHRSRLLTIAVIPILFSRSARHFFQNDSTLRANNTLCLVSNSFFLFVLKYLLINNSCVCWGCGSSLYCKTSTAWCICTYLCFQDTSAAPTESSLAMRMANKRKSVAIPVDSTLRRFIQSVDEVSYFFLTCWRCSCVPSLNLHIDINI